MRIRRMVTAIGAAALIASGIAVATAPAASAVTVERSGNDIVIDVDCDDFIDYDNLTRVEANSFTTITVIWEACPGADPSYVKYAPTGVPSLFTETPEFNTGLTNSEQLTATWRIGFVSAGVYGAGVDEFAFGVDASDGDVPWRGGISLFALRSVL